MNKTTTVQRRSGSASRRKKSQKTPSNPPKPIQRVVLHPPKFPQQPRLVLRSSKQSLSNRTNGDWMSVSLIGNGSDASYHYGDICTVQAIMKIFNGRSSARSIFDDVEGKHKDTESTPDDHILAELEMNDILQEALDCHHCDDAINLSPDTMEADIRHGIYRCSQDPPFVLNQPCEEAAPDEMPQEIWEPGYIRLATKAQHQRYCELVQKHMARNRESRTFDGMGDVDQGYETKFAVYCVDYHIHQHYLHRRSPLNLCRTNDEMDDIRYWKYKLALWAAHQHSPLRPDSLDEVDEAIGHRYNAHEDAAPTEAVESGATNQYATSPPASPTSSTFSSPHSSASTAASSPPGPSSFRLPSPAILPWPKQEFSISSQIALHRCLINPRERAARVRASRKRFQSIMKTRALQRRESLAKAEREAALAWHRWQQGIDGPLAIARDGDIGRLLQHYDR